MAVAGERRQAPLALERLAQPRQVARRRGEVRLLDLDEIEAHDRVDLDRVRVGLLAHDLAVDLALGRHVDDDVAGHGGGAAEPAPGVRPRSTA